ncbi:hypothetical protein SEPCBS119000_004119 [Sporothrix epigloea]|uniref:ubiquitinyl hydrolase 1 n=1 Tax=Sporothrix epigloea TaxID=1892477 RepID=A0ABP0DS63_9PEZI
MNNNHLPAGRAAHGAGSMPSMAEVSGTGFGPQQGSGGAAHIHNGHNGHNGHIGHNGHGGYNGHHGHHGGRGGGARRGRHYNGYNYNNQYQHHAPHSQHNQLSHHNQQGQHNQFAQQMFAQQGYVPPFNNQQYGYPPMPPSMPPNYMHFAQQQQQYQQPPYGRPSTGMQGHYAPMGGAPMGMHPMASPSVLPHQHAPLGPLAQHSPALSHNVPQQHAPLVVSTPQPDQFAMHPAIPPHQSPVVHSPYLPSSVQASMGLPPSLPPHNPIPPHREAHKGVSNGFGAINPFSSAATAGATATTAPLELSSTNASAPEHGKQDEIINGSAAISSVEPQLIATPDTAPATTPTPETSSVLDSIRTAPTETTEAAPIDPLQAGKPFEKISLPWSSSDVPMPPRQARRRRRRDMDGANVQLPPSQQEVTTIALTAISSSANALPSTPSSPKATATPLVSTDRTATSSGSSAIPVNPVLPTEDKQPSNATINSEPSNAEDHVTAAPESNNAPPAEPTAVATPPAPSGPKLWADLFLKSASGVNGGVVANGHAANGTNGAGAFMKANANSLTEAVALYRVGSSDKVAFIEPRGLINTGNMCYMNSVLQVLTFCVPFYDFLDQVGQKAAFSFKSETPMIDAMIMFLREFRVIDRASPADLRKRLKSDTLERYGEAFTPELVYHAINQLPRFSSMIRGQQQDAEEFLGFLLESLNEECAKVLRDATVANGSAPTSGQATPTTGTAEVPALPSNGSGWVEVGHRQRAVVTRSSGHSLTSPVNSIFSGLLRSELRVPGHKDSVTLEPYQSLQLHIDSLEVRNIVDALRNLTNPEVLHGSFKSPQGKDVSATKQVYIEDLPPVLILHLKRFQFDWQVNGTVKIWKKVGYPLELEIPREIFSRAKRNTLLSKPLPKYQLNAVVYHHGKQASGGHYTVDVLREDGREWIRLDDTFIRRIRREEVAEAGAEETGTTSNNSSSATANGKREATSATTSGSNNRFSGVDDDDAGENDNGWSAPVNGNGKKWSTVANGVPSPKHKQHPKDDIKDNKVAYLLFYQRIN